YTGSVGGMAQPALLAYERGAGAMASLTGKVIAVTGASRGVEAAIAIRLPALGPTPVLLARPPAALEQTAERIPGERLILQADVTDQAQIDRAAQEILSRYGRIDGWVNNAGAGLFKPVTEMPIEEFSMQMDINYLSIVRCVKAVLPHMLSA